MPDEIPPLGFGRSFPSTRIPSEAIRSASTRAAWSDRVRDRRTASTDCSRIIGVSELGTAPSCAELTDVMTATLPIRVVGLPYLAIMPTR